MYSRPLLRPCLAHLFPLTPLVTSRRSSADVDHRGQQLHGPPSRRSPAWAALASSGLTEQRLLLHRPATYLQRPVARQISRRISSTMRSSGAVAITPPLHPPEIDRASERARVCQ